MSDYRLVEIRQVEAHELPSNYDTTSQTVPLTDELIATALRFEGHHPEFLKWPKHLWKDPENGVPCEDPEKNAYHVRFLAEEMRRTGKWFGNRPQIWTDNKARGGSHRIRAAKYLHATTGIAIKVDAKFVERS